MSNSEAPGLEPQPKKGCPGDYGACKTVQMFRPWALGEVPARHPDFGV